MGQQQSKTDEKAGHENELTTDDEPITSDDEVHHSDEEVEVAYDEERGGGIMDILTVSALSSTSYDTDEEASSQASSEASLQEKDKPQRPMPLRKFLCCINVILLLIIIAGITVPLVVMSMKEKPDSGADVNFGDVGAMPRSQDEVLPPSSQDAPSEDEEILSKSQDEQEEDDQDKVLPTSSQDAPSGDEQILHQSQDDIDEPESTLDEVESVQNMDGMVSTQENESPNSQTAIIVKEATNTTSEEETTTTTEEGNTFAPKLLPKLPFEDVKLPHFASELMGGYANRTQFEEALAEAAKFLINKVVLQHLGFTSPPLALDNVHGFTWRGSDQEEAQSFPDLTDFESNNQEAGIDEADMMKADANYIYAAYSNYVLVWDKNGNQIAQTKMPTETESNGSSSNYLFGGGIFSGAFGTFSGHKAHVESLLLAGEYLVVIVSGYESSESGEKRALTSYKGTQIRTYKTASIATDGELTLVGTKDVNGRFMDARSIGNQVHVTTISGIDTHTHLTSHLNRYVNFPELSDDEYVERVRALALEQYIPAFVDKLSNELTYQDHTQNTVLPNLLQLNRWQSSTEDTPANVGHALVDAGMFQTGLINSVSLITSLDVTALPLQHSSRSSHELVAATSAILAPSYQTRLYGTASKLVLATQAWNWNSETEASEEVTHLIVLKLEDQHATSATSFHSLGTVRGFLLNPYSLDIEGNDLRVATTIGRRWRFRGIPQLSSNAVDVGDHSSAQVSAMDRSAEDASVVEDSVTENYITVFDLASNDLLQERGSIQLGEEDEIITAVRFFRDIAYCVTFKQTDPFYVVDLKDIATLGSFKMNGFSNYLHPLNDDNTLILGIGQNTTDEGVPIGFMVTVFDATDPTNPKALASYTVDDSPAGTSSGADGAAIRSAAQWDHKSFRYVDGKLIVPLDITTYSTEGSTDDAIRQTILGSFEGFLVFNVSPDAISEHIRISHVTNACHYCGYLAPRSFVYDGNVVTAQGNIVSSTSLSRRYEQWAFHVSVIGEEARCCY